MYLYYKMYYKILKKAKKNGKNVFFCYEVFDYELNFYFFYYTVYYIFMYI